MVFFRNKFALYALKRRLLFRAILNKYSNGKKILTDVIPWKSYPRLFIFILASSPIQSCNGSNKCHQSLIEAILIQ